jgi:hypothetical protein
MFNVFEQLDKNEIKFTKKEIETKVAIIGISSRLPKSIATLVSISFLVNLISFLSSCSKTLNIKTSLTFLVH